MIYPARWPGETTATLDPVMVHRGGAWHTLTTQGAAMNQPNADQFIQKAKDSVIVVEYPHYQFIPNELYVVWFCKALGNWKALVSTDVWDGAYWEVTYNGAKQETYVDTYAKRSNVAIKDEETV